jgi:hypothetical protein
VRLSHWIEDRAAEIAAAGERQPHKDVA